MRRLAFAALSLAFLATACQPATELTEEQKAAIEEEVTQRQADWLDALNSLDVERWQSFLADDVQWLMPQGSFTTKDIIGPAIEEWMSTVSEQRSVNDDVFVRALGPDAAVVGLTGHGTSLLANGESTEGRSAMTCVWAREDGVWRVVHGVFIEITEQM